MLKNYIGLSGEKIQDVKTHTSTDYPVEQSKLSAKYGWYCEKCKRFIPNEEVTFEETHDTRSGGCGYAVISKIKNAVPRWIQVFDNEKGDITLVINSRIIGYIKTKLNANELQQLMNGLNNFKQSSEQQSKLSAEEMESKGNKVKFLINDVCKWEESPGYDSLEKTLSDKYYVQFRSQFEGKELPEEELRGAPFDDPENVNPLCDKCDNQNSENCNTCKILQNE